jgi:hypothetical protein
MINSPKHQPTFQKVPAMKIDSIRNVASRMQNLAADYASLQEQFKTFVAYATTAADPKVGGEGVVVTNKSEVDLKLTFAGRSVQFSFDAISRNDQLHGRILCREVRGTWCRTVVAIEFNANGDTTMEGPDGNLLSIDVEPQARALVWHCFALVLQHDVTKSESSEWTQVL